MKKNGWLVFKLIVIVLFWGLLFRSHQASIQAVIQQPQLNWVERSIAITRILLGTVSSPDAPDNQSVQTSVGTTNSTYSTPRQIDQAVIGHPNYQKAVEVSEQFNQRLNLGALNQAFNALINEQRAVLDWESVVVGEHLASGTNERVQQLSDNHYLGAQTVMGGDFRELFAFENTAQRLGENLYELYISADDIHLSTWEKPEILAEYLMKTFESTTTSELYQTFSSQYITIRAAASDYLVDSQPYIRLVVVLVMDTEVE